MKCEICPRKIPATRLAYRPNTKTCSAKCSKERQKRLRRDIMRRRRKEERQEAAAAATA